MDREYRLKIFYNLDFIATNVCCLPKLLNCLLQNAVLSDLEVQTVKSHKTEYEAATELANLICKKDSKIFPVFIQCLNESENKAIAQKLMTHNKVVAKEISTPIWFGMTSPTRFYVGREKEMELLGRYWDDCLENKTFTIIAVTGLGGVGKTELTKNYAELFYKTVKGHCIWIDAETNQSLIESFRSLANHLNITLIDDFGKERMFLEIVREVYEKLFREKVLLVLDNVENYELSVLKILNGLSRKQPPTVLKPFVITTSRLCEAKKYFGNQCNLIDLQVLSKESAVEFFSKSLSIDEPPTDIIYELIEKLCQRLQNYPLALQQASAYINQKLPFCGTLYTAISIYLDQLEKLSKKLLNHKIPQYEAMENISNTTFLTWRITFDKLKEEEAGEEVVDIMNIISFLSSDEIPIHIVLNILQKMGKIVNLTNLENFLDLIRKYSMIHYSNEKFISVHRLVQEVTRIELEERGHFRLILNEIAKSMVEMLRSKAISLKALVHAQIVWQHLSKDKEMIEEHGELLRCICVTMNKSGKYRDVLDFSSESGYLVESVVEKNSRWALHMNYWRGRALRSLGASVESLQVLKQVYEKQKEVYGKEDEHCLDTANEVGIGYWQLNKYEEATKIFEDVLEIRERLNGKEGQRTFALKNNIALILKGQNKLEEAMKLHEEILGVCQQVLGVDNFTTMMTKYNIADIKLLQKDYRQAEMEFKQVLEMQERILEFNHPLTLINKYCIAQTCYHLGKHQEGLQLANEVYANQVRLLGPRHPDAVNTEAFIQVMEDDNSHQSSLRSSKTNQTCLIM